MNMNVFSHAMTNTLDLFKRCSLRAVLTAQEIRRDQVFLPLIDVLQEHDERWQLRHPVLAVGLRLPRAEYLEAVSIVQNFCQRFDLPLIENTLDNRNWQYDKYHPRLFGLGPYEYPKWGLIESVGNEHQQGLYLIISTLHPMFFHKRLQDIGMTPSEYPPQPGLFFTNEILPELVLNAQPMRLQSRVFVSMVDYQSRAWYPPGLKPKKPERIPLSWESRPVVSRIVDEAVIPGQ